MKKVLLYIFLFCLLPVSSLFAQPADVLQRADSLFELKKYGKSYELYSQLDSEGYESPAMLLRMAFIREGLNDNSKALYFLNRYYLLTYDRNTLSKMAELAEEENLEGYSLNDFRLFETFFARYYDTIILTLAALALLFLLLAVWRKVKYKERPTGLAIASWSTMALLLLVINVNATRDYAILDGQQVYLMSGPSAGADLVEVVSAGHKVKVEDTSDIWAEVEWEEGKAWVRTSRLLTLQP